MWSVRWLGFDERDVDGAGELPGGKAENPISRTVVAVPDEHAMRDLEEIFSLNRSYKQRRALQPKPWRWEMSLVTQWRRV
jgi:hypothetical protein